MPETPDLLVAQLVWRPSYESGNKPIDDHHRELVARGNAIIAAAMDGESSATIGRLFEDLLKEVAGHFQHEESILDRERPDELERHRILHNDILNRAVRLRLQLDRGEMPTASLIDFFGHKLLLDHIVNEDLPLLRLAPAAG